jgi:MFS family permease
MNTPASPSAGTPVQRLTSVQWLICTIASIGFAFDIYELLMLPLILEPALQELGGLQLGMKEYTQWARTLFYVPAIAGGVFGLLGGYLTDRLGRRRLLTFSILLYAFSAFFAGFSTSLVQLLVFRCLVFVGVCLEFVAAVAWLAELFDDPGRRERVLGYTQAFSSLGGLLVALANRASVAWAGGLPGIGGLFGDVLDPHAAWRYTLMSGVIPALPLIFIRPFLPESPKWEQKRAAGTLKRPSLFALFSPELRRTTIVTTLMFACSLGAAFGAIQQIPQIVPFMAQVKEERELRTKGDEGKKYVEDHLGSKQVQAMVDGKGEDERKKILARERQKATITFSRKVGQARASEVQTVQEVGGLVGRTALAVLATIFLSRARLIRTFLLPGLIIMPLVFGYAAVNSLTLLWIGIFLAGFFTVAQLSFWGNYLPRVYPIHLRGTGEGFAANIGGRLIGTGFAWVTQTLAFGFVPAMPPETPPAKLAEIAAPYLAYTAAGVAVFCYLANIVLSFFMTEPPKEDLPE